MNPTINPTTFKKIEYLPQCVAATIPENYAALPQLNLTGFNCSANPAGSNRGILQISSWSNYNNAKPDSVRTFPSSPSIGSAAVCFRLITDCSTGNISIQVEAAPAYQNKGVFGVARKVLVLTPGEEDGNGIEVIPNY